jgi:hypothetical protein
MADFFSSEDLTRLILLFNGKLVLLFQTYNIILYVHACRLAENDIITRGVTIKIQQVAVRGNYENPTDDAKGEDE